MHKGIINATIDEAIREYGTGISPIEKIRLPRNTTQKGIITER